MPDESIYDESAHRQHEAETAVVGEDTDAALIAEKRAAALGLKPAAPPVERKSKSAKDETAS